MAPLVSLLAPLLGDVVRKVVPDKNRQQEIERELKLTLMENAESLEQLRGEIVLAEAKSEHWITATWRPLLMLITVGIIGLNYLIFPVLGIWVPDVMTHVLELPDPLWDMLTLGVGGYIVGRSGEKMVDRWTKPQK